MRHDLPNGTTLVSTAVLEHRTAFLLFQGMGDTPDGFGNQTAIAFGNAQQVMFTADGLFVDQAGNLVNGSIFIGELNKPLSARAADGLRADGGHPHVSMERFGLETLDMRVGRDESGFTLIEVTIAMIMLMVGVLALAGGDCARRAADHRLAGPAARE